MSSQCGIGLYGELNLHDTTRATLGVVTYAYFFVRIRLFLSNSDTIDILCLYIYILFYFMKEEKMSEVRNMCILHQSRLYQ